jgi:predicted DCC family thiol-disulfide oxidoreductase YuxK
MQARENPPAMSAEDRVVLFDGVCVLCNYWARFLIRFDSNRRYKIAAVQSDEGRAILAWCGLPTDHFDTLVYVEGREFYVRSTAIIKVLAGLRFPWKLAAIAFVFPRPLRDWAYDHMARHRYKIFGKHDECVLPTPDHLSRILQSRSES